MGQGEAIGSIASPASAKMTGTLLAAAPKVEPHGAELAVPGLLDGGSDSKEAILILDSPMKIKPLSSSGHATPELRLVEKMWPDRSGIRDMIAEGMKMRKEAGDPNPCSGDLTCESVKTLGHYCEVMSVTCGLSCTCP